MADFPSSVKTFTTKVAHVDKVQASHINDLQDEVEAIETTLLSGTEGEVLTAGAEGIPTWGEVESGVSQGADISSNYVSEDTITGMAVSDAGSVYLNGNYIYSGEDGGKPQYIHETNEAHIYWDDDGYWIIHGEEGLSGYAYYSEEDVATPDLVENWEVETETDAEEPVPTVTAIIESTLQNEDSGKVLTADGSGGASWETPSGGGTIQWITSANSANELLLECYTNAGLASVGDFGKSKFTFLLLNNDSLYLAYYLGGDFSGYYVKHVRNYGSAVWVSGEIKLIGMYFAYANDLSYDWAGV